MSAKKKLSFEHVICCYYFALADWTYWPTSYSIDMVLSYCLVHHERCCVERWAQRLGSIWMCVFLCVCLCVCMSVKNGINNLFTWTICPNIFVKNKDTGSWSSYQTSMINKEMKWNELWTFLERNVLLC